MKNTASDSELKSRKNGGAYHQARNSPKRNVKLAGLQTAKWEDGGATVSSASETPSTVDIHIIM